MPTTAESEKSSSSATRFGPRALPLVTSDDPHEVLELFHSKRDLVDYYSDSLKFVWDKWLFAIHAVIGFSGTTALVLLNALIQTEGLHTQSVFVRLSFLFAIAALVAAIAWRFSAQHYMEHAILGAPQLIRAYFQSMKISDSISYGPLDKSGRGCWAFRLVYYLGFFLALGLLITSWLCGLVFITRIT